MTTIGRLNRAHTIRRSALVVLLLAGAMFAQASQRARAPRPMTRPLEAQNRFIAAFELSPEKGWTFMWPYSSMRPAPYDSVLMKVKAMPRAWDERSRRWLPLIAAKALKVNGALQRPLRPKAAEPGEQYEVRLNQGRLRVALIIPQGMTIDRRYRTVRIELYEINRPRPD